MSKLGDIDVTLAHNSSGILNVAVWTVAVRFDRPPFSGRSKITTFPLLLTMVALSLSFETVNLHPSVDDQVPSARLRAGYRDGVGGQPGKGRRGFARIKLEDDGVVCYQRSKYPRRARAPRGGVDFGITGPSDRWSGESI